jgi:hypothetical protein
MSLCKISTGKIRQGGWAYDSASLDASIFTLLDNLTVEILETTQRGKGRFKSVEFKCKVVNPNSERHLGDIFIPRSVFIVSWKAEM